MADKKEAAKKAPEAKAPKPKEAQKEKSAAQKALEADPALAKYQALLIQNEDKKLVENSLLISLCVFIALTFIVFPEFAKKIIEATQQDDVIEIPKQTIIKKEEKKEQKKEVRRKEEQREREFNQIPDISRPTGDEEIVEDIKADELEINIDDFDDVDFGAGPSAPPGPIEVAGDVVKPEVTFKGAQPFPQKAKILRRSGKVSVRLIIRKNGTYEVVRVTREDPPGFGFGDACLQYLKQSSWKPAMQNGRPIDVYFELTIMFNLK